ncbi:DUF6695 family protein [Arcticibacterium luteifluviistationis]|uniref:Type VI secretion system effector TseH-like domain-containing protein n=1 Tax=Arcticibacterium luteifluviistationis TaxID=1784714 RepID=A0A2Z4GBF1_9BACT|nr:DUF6695 family protein [Arcticibacterium luteifluviistationis]AWV98464.1 hypothetical protein DJ013_09885 [Arcticibacterium luteifluviistationis]
MYSGWAIALAWPETHCKATGAWYDKPAGWLGLHKDYYYKVGHAAVILIKNFENEALYLDFGRYHAPYGHGRVRDKFTDHELKLKTILEWSEAGKLLNINELLVEIEQKEACHGNGKVHPGISQVNFKLAYKKAKDLQSKGCLAYGPFVKNGTNCSRFVNTIIKAGRPKLWTKVRLSLPPTISPTPLGNVKSLSQISSSIATTSSLNVNQDISIYE